MKKKIPLVALVLALSSSAAFGWVETRKTLSVDVGIGAPYGFVGIGIEWAPEKHMSLFGGLSALRGEPAYLGAAAGARIYPLGNEGRVNAFFHYFIGWAGFVFEDKTAGEEYQGGGGGLEFLFENGGAIRLGADYFTLDGEYYTFPFLAYGEKF